MEVSSAGGCQQGEIKLLLVQKQQANDCYMIISSFYIKQTHFLEG